MGLSSLFDLDDEMEMSAAAVRGSCGLALTYIDCELNVVVVCCRSVNRVQYLDLSMAVVSVQTLEDLLSSCVHLLRLSLESCHLSNNVCR